MTRPLRTPFLLTILLLFSLFAGAQHTYFQTGDIFLGQGGGIIQWRDANGTLIRNINTGDGGGNGNGTGLRIHPVTGRLWVTNSNLPPGSPKGIRIINTDGTPGNTVDVSAYQGTPTSITFDKQGNAYIGDLWSPVIVKIDPSGTTILDHYNVSVNNYVWGPEWVEMDCNDSIIYYTNLRERVKRYNVATRQQLPDFADLSGIPTWLFAMRLLPDSGMIVVSADNRVLRLNAAGTIIRSYTPASPCGFFGLAATPGGKSFWAGGLAFYGPMYKFDIASGQVVDSFMANQNQGANIHGIAIYGDQLKNCHLPDPPPPVVKGLRVYPDPGNGNFTIETALTGKLSVSIYSRSGQLVFAKEYTSAGNRIPVSLPNMAAGIYYLQVLHEKGRHSQRIVIY